MSTSNVIIPPEFSQPIINREKIWADYDNSQRLAAELDQLLKHIPECESAALQLQFGIDSIPSNELQTVLTMLNQELETSNRLRDEANSCRAEIDAIKRKEKTIIMAAIGGGVVLVLVFLIIILSVLSNAGPR
jgi:prefoldin subunit 5